MTCFNAGGQPPNPKSEGTRVPPTHGVDAAAEERETRARTCQSSPRQLGPCRANECASRELLEQHDRDQGPQRFPDSRLRGPQDFADREALAGCVGGGCVVVSLMAHGRQVAFYGIRSDHVSGNPVSIQGRGKSRAKEGERGVVTEGSPAPARSQRRPLLFVLRRERCSLLRVIG